MSCGEERPRPFLPRQSGRQAVEGDIVVIGVLRLRGRGNYSAKRKQRACQSSCAAAALRMTPMWRSPHRLQRCNAVTLQKIGIKNRSFNRHPSDFFRDFRASVVKPSRYRATLSSLTKLLQTDSLRLVSLKVPDHYAGDSETQGPHDARPHV